MTAGLIARLEAATEGSRELDADIGEEVFGYGLSEDRTAMLVAVRNRYPTGEEYEEWDDVPRFTDSLDAALTLIGSECFWRIGHDGEGPNPGDFLAEVMTADHRPVRAVAATAAVALCIVALKAGSAS